MDPIFFDFLNEKIDVPDSFISCMNIVLDSDTYHEVASKLEDIVKLSQILNENGFANKDITISIGVKTPEMLNRINEEIYFRNSNKENHKGTLV